MSSFSGRMLCVIAMFMAAAVTGVAQSSYDLRSPDSRIELRIRSADRVHYDVLLNGRALLENCTLSMDVEHKKLGIAPKVLDAKQRSNDQIIRPTIRQKFAQLRDAYNELHLTMDGGYAVTIRAYNEGVAYRFETSLPQQQVKVYAEESNWNFPQDSIVYYPQEDSFFSQRTQIHATTSERDYSRLHCHASCRSGCWRRRESGDCRVRCPRLSGTLAKGHARHWTRSYVSAVSAEREAGRRSRFPRGRSCRLHCCHFGYAYVSLACGRCRREGWRSDYELAGLAARKSVAGSRHLLDQAGQGLMGLVERE